VFSKKNLDRLPRAECDSELPVFIACRPRSGSTLIERIIGSHPQAHPAGEFSALLNHHRQDAIDIGSLDPYPKCALDLDRNDVNMLSEKYSPRSGSSARSPPHYQQASDELGCASAWRSCSSPTRE
jgi:hypothetical protein